MIYFDACYIAKFYLLQGICFRVRRTQHGDRRRGVRGLGERGVEEGRMGSSTPGWEGKFRLIWPRNGLNALMGLFRSMAVPLRCAKHFLGDTWRAQHHPQRKKAPALADRSPDNLSVVGRHGFSFESPQRFVAFFEIESHDAV